MIPKIIHYIWLGKNKKPDNFDIVFESWKKYAPGFQLKEWGNESFLEFDLPNYFHKAIKEKKYAFASDVLRVYILEKYGGVYVDIDQMFVQGINQLWNLELNDVSLFTATYHEVSDYFGFQFFGTASNHVLMKKMIDFYKNYTQEKYIIINKVFSDILNNQIVENKQYIEKEYIKIFPQEYFYPLDKNSFTKNTYTYHLGNVSWQPRWKHYVYKFKLYFWLKERFKKFLPKGFEY